MSLRSMLGVARRELLCSCNRRLATLKNNSPMISFAFDDFPRTAYTTGGSILQEHGAHGTFYAACGLMNTSNELGDQFRAGDLDGVLENGHELASHTFSHVSCRALPLPTFCADVERGRKAVEEITGAESPNFAYPFGHVTLRAKPALEASTGSARGIFPGLNGPEVDLNLLRANSLYGDLDGLGRADELIAANVRNNGWLIFYTHDVRPNPSPYGCTPRLFESVVSRASASGSKILSVNEALTAAGIQNGNPQVQGRNYAHL
jgi:peptidoglycan/xylan/chitin deacetylase (PgdA/CDA1 family)